MTPPLAQSRACVRYAIHCAFSRTDKAPAARHGRKSLALSEEKFILYSSVQVETPKGVPPTSGFRMSATSSRHIHQLAKRCLQRQECQGNPNVFSPNWFCWQLFSDETKSKPFDGFTKVDNTKQSSRTTSFQKKPKLIKDFGSSKDVSFTFKMSKKSWSLLRPHSSAWWSSNIVTSKTTTSTPVSGAEECQLFSLFISFQTQIVWECSCSHGLAIKCPKPSSFLMLSKARPPRLALTPREQTFRGWRGFSLNVQDLNALKLKIRRQSSLSYCHHFCELWPCGSLGW